MADGPSPTRVVPPLPGGARLRNTFLEFEEALGEEGGEDEDPWVITLNPRRLKTDSVVERSSLRSQIDSNLGFSRALCGHLDSSKPRGRDAAESGPLDEYPRAADGRAVAATSSQAVPSERSVAHVSSEPPASPEVNPSPQVFGWLSQLRLDPGAASSNEVVAPSSPGPIPIAEWDWHQQLQLQQQVQQVQQMQEQMQQKLQQAQQMQQVQQNPQKQNLQQPMQQVQEAHAMWGAGSPSVEEEELDDTSQDDDALLLQQEGSMEDASKGKSVAVNPAVAAARELAAAGGGLSGNTTVMVRHVPAKYTQQKLMREINSAGFLGKYDFFYLPMQPQSRGNRGFAFVNFATAQAAEAFYAAFHGKRLRHLRSEQPIAVMPADLQGFERNAEHYASLRKVGSRRPLQSGRALFFKPLPPHLACAGDVATPDGAIVGAPSGLARAAVGSPGGVPGSTGAFHPTSAGAAGLLEAVGAAGVTPTASLAAAAANAASAAAMAAAAGGGQSSAFAGLGAGGCGQRPPAARRPQAASQRLAGEPARPSVGANVHRFCAFCGKPKAPEHLNCAFCAFCGARCPAPPHA